METESLKHWIISSPESLGGNVAGLRTPDAVAALVIDGFSTDDGQTFEFPPFEAGRQDAIFMVLPEEVGLKVFERMEKYVAGRQSAKENLEDENEVIAARWSLGNEKLAILVGDSGGASTSKKPSKPTWRLRRFTSSARNWPSSPRASMQRRC